MEDATRTELWAERQLSQGKNINLSFQIQMSKFGLEKGIKGSNVNDPNMVYMQVITLCWLGALFSISNSYYCCCHFYYNFWCYYINILCVTCLNRLQGPTVFQQAFMGVWLWQAQDWVVAVWWAGLSTLGAHTLRTSYINEQISPRAAQPMRQPSGVWNAPPSLGHLSLVEKGHKSRMRRDLRRSWKPEQESRNHVKLLFHPSAG